MGIDNSNDYRPDGTFARTFTLVSSLSGAIAEAQGKKDAIKVIELAPGQNPGKVEMGNYTFDFTAAPGRRGGAGRGPATTAAPAPAGGVGPASFVDGSYVLIINTAPDEYYFATNGNYPFQVSAKVPGANITTPASIDRGAFINGKWVMSHRFNGDDIMGRGYDLSNAAANNLAGTQIPLGARGRNAASAAAGATPPPTIVRVRFYHYR
jgi:hypothetical protein